MTIPLIPLPYSVDALDPHISKKTLELHHGAHHKGYVDKTNDAIGGTRLAGADLNQIVVAARGNAELFDSASQAWNHGFYWHSLAPRAGEPSGRLKEAIERDFGSVAALKSKLAEVAGAHFASGWAWLVAREDKLSVVDTHDAASPFSEGSGNPLLTIDVWEHAYYLDVQNQRPAYVEAVVDNLLNWEFASENFERGDIWRYPSDASQSQVVGFAEAE